MKDGFAGFRDATRDRLDKVQRAADEASRMVRNLTFIFLLVVLYIFIIAAGTDDETLFRDGDIQMPLLNVGVPISSFYALVPFLFLILHGNLLLQYFFLSRKLHLLNTVRNQVISGDLALREHRWLLFPLPFSQLIAGREHGPAVDRLLKIMVWVILVGLPVALLLWLQLRFLPFQDPWIVSIHRFVLFFDLVLIWAVYPRLIEPPGHWWRWFVKRHPKLARLGRLAGPTNWRLHLLVPRWSRSRRSIGARPQRGLSSERRGRPTGPNLADLGTVAVLFLSCFVAVHPYGPVERVTPFLDWSRGMLFDRPGNYLHRSLDVQGKILVAEEPPAELLALYVGGRLPSDLVTAEAAVNGDAGIGDETVKRRARRDQAFREYSTTLSLKGRGFRKAQLAQVKVFSAILTGADLRGANLIGTDLQGADLNRANLQDAFLFSANLDGASLFRADLEGAVLGNARLRRAHLAIADLRRAQLDEADLRGAQLDEANLRGASLSDTALQGASLTRADLRDAELYRANLQGAKLYNANLRGAKLVGADLRGANIEGADLQGAELRNADLNGAILVGADLRGAVVEGADFSAADLRFTDLRGVSPWKTTPGEQYISVHLKLADLRDARIGPLAEEETDELIDRIEKAAGNNTLTQQAAEGLRNRMSKSGIAPSESELPSALVLEASVPIRLNDEVGRASRTWLAGLRVMAPEVYERALGDYLAGLACGEGSNEYVADGVALRALGDGGVILMHRLATALLDDECKGYAGYLDTLSEKQRELERRRLERLVAPSVDAEAGGG